VNGSGESRTAVELPVEAGAEHRGVLHGVGEPGLVLAEVDPLRRGAVPGNPELDPEEAARGGGGDVHVDDPVAKLEIIQARRGAIEEQRLPTLMAAHLGLSLEPPARRTGRARRRVGGRRRTSDEADTQDQDDRTKHRETSIPPGPVRPLADATARV